LEGGRLPCRARARKIADFDGNVKVFSQPEAHDSPSLSWGAHPHKSPRQYNAIPIAK
jgi:hypothetical protein